MSRARVGFLLVSALFAAAVGYGVSRLVSPGSSRSSVAALNLTKAGRYDTVALIGARIVVYEAQSPSLKSPSTWGTCSSPVVDPSTLALGEVRRGSCADPATIDRSVSPLISVDDRVPSSGGGLSAVVRIARVTARSPGYAIGPIVMTFSAWAWGNTQPSWIYGGGDLWLYDWTDHFDLRRISATTGAVLQRLVIPRIQSPLLAFNDEGLWIAPFGDSTGSLYRLSPGATSVSSVFRFASDGFAHWLVASGDSVWLDAQRRPVSQTATLWELQGPDAEPVWHEASTKELDSTWYGFESVPAMVGNGADGLWTVVTSASGDKQQVIRVDSRTGKRGIVATLRPRSRGVQFASPPPPGTWTGVVDDGSLFLVDPRSQPGSELELNTLYRITPAAP